MLIKMEAETADLARLQDSLRNGDIVSLPTETVYGLVCDATNSLAITKLYTLKDRKAQQPLQVLVPSLETATNFGVFSEVALTLAKHYWPGPLTLIVPRKAEAVIAPEISGDSDTIGLRAPDHPLTQSLLQAYNKPLAATSANPAGQPSPTSAKEVEAYFGDKISLIVDAGPCTIGLSSTVVDCTIAPPKILREGSVSSAQINEALDG